VTAVRYAREHLVKVVQQMPAIRHLGGVGSTGCCTFGIIVAAVAADDPYPRMALEPPLEGLR
jgi:hypothetical protein